MYILERRPWDLPSSEITSYELYMDRRRFIGRGVGLLTAAMAAPGALAAAERPGEPGSSMADGAGQDVRKWAPALAENDELTPFEDVTRYNNFYEFGVDKEDPVRNSGAFKPRPWSVTVEGHCGRPGTYDLDDFLKGLPVEERTYRLRCVEAWSMVIPWLGVPLRNALLAFEPTNDARFVEFTTVVRPSEMPGQRRRILPWPYVEGLRLDEALNELAFLSTGLYGKDLPNQNGAPLRLIVPWKYGFKSIKSIVKVRFTDQMPENTWQIMASNEYGFFANVNPEVDHPRWSQARERRIGEFRKRPTLMFNGYGEHVAHMYAGMDLTKWY